MTDKASPDVPNDLATFLRDWAELWRQELRAQARDTGTGGAGASGTAAGDTGGVALDMLVGLPNAAMSAEMLETWRAAVVAWAEILGVPPSAAAGSGDRAATPRAKAAAVAPDARDAAVERLARRVDELEARLAKLESPRRGRG